MKRDTRFIILAVALVLFPVVGITAAQIFPLFDPPVLPWLQPQPQCAPGQKCCPPKASAPSRLVPIPDPWTSTTDAPCKPGQECPGHPIRRPLVPVEPYVPPKADEPPPTTWQPSVVVEIGEVLTVGPDVPASVSIHEDEADAGRYLLTFSIPRGRDGRDGAQGEQGSVGDRGSTGVSPTVDVKAIAREAAKGIPAFFWVRRLDVATGDERLEKIPLGEGFTILNFPPE